MSRWLDLGTVIERPGAQIDDPGRRSLVVQSRVRQAAQANIPATAPLG
jgi:hypothetical protein